VFVTASARFVEAAGGSRSLPGAYAQPAWVAVTGGSTGSSGSLPNVIHNDFVIVLVGFSGKAQTVKAGGVSDTGRTSFTKTASSSSNQDTEIWCGQYTAASGSDTVTVQSTASANYVFTVYILSGLSSCTADTSKTGNGGVFGATMSVASFTPTTGDACIGMGNEFTGHASVTFTQQDPFLTDNAGAPNTSPNFNTNHYAVTILRGAWNANDGATTATITPSAFGSATWDEVVSCYPTSSAGNEVYNSNGRGGGRGSGNTPNEGVNGVLKGDYILQLTVVGGTAITVSSVTDANGAGDTFTKAGGSDIYNDVEIWIAKAAQTNDAGFQVTSHLTGTAAGSVVNGWDIGSIASTTPEIFTNSGTGPVISLPAFTPNPFDLCVEDASINTGNAGGVVTSFSVPPNQPFQDIASSASSGVGLTTLYSVSVMRANWPSGLSTTGTITPSATTSPQWDVVVVCFPGTVIVPLTCTMDNSAPMATLSLSESSGNALSPTTAACDGGSHNITVDPSITLTATEPADALTSRDRFSGGTTTTVVGTCAGAALGVCSAWSFTNYNQLSNTYQATPSNPTTWDAALSIQVTGTLAGSTGQTVCTVNTSNGGGAASCTGFADYNRLVTMTSPVAVSGTEQWVQSGGNSFSDTTGGNPPHNVNYVDQFLITIRVVPGGAGSTVPPGPTAWMNVGSDAISASANAGSAFSIWTAGGSVVIASPSSASTSATISGTGAMTAWFSTLASDGFAFSDSPTMNVVLPRVAADPFALSDAVSGSLNLPRDLSDSLTFSESFSRTLALPRAPSDSLLFADAFAVTSAFGRAVRDVFSVSDSASRALSLNGVASDLYGFADNAGSALAFLRNAADAWGSSDLASRAVNLNSLARDLFAVSDSVSRQLQLLHGVSDAFPFSDSLRRAVRPLRYIHEYLVDNFPFSDSPVRNLSLLSVLGDRFPFLSDTMRNVELSRTAMDNYLLSATTNGLASFYRGVTDLFNSAANAISSVRSSGQTTSTTSPGGGARSGLLAVLIFWFPWLLLLLALIAAVAYVRRRQRQR
jgi:hypothetical protein